MGKSKCRKCGMCGKKFPTDQRLLAHIVKGCDWDDSQENPKTGEWDGQDVAASLDLAGDGE